MLTRRQPDTPVNIPDSLYALPPQALDARVQQLESQLSTLVEEHVRLMTALQTSWDVLNQPGALEIVAARINGTPIGDSDHSTGKFTDLVVTGNLGLSSHVSVKDPRYGAKGDGVTNDTTAIAAALAAANAAGLVLHFPSGTYLNTNPIAITTSIGGVSCEGRAVLKATGASTNGFTFAAGNYYSHRFDLPDVVDYVNGSGVLLNGCTLAHIRIRGIANCLWGLDLQTIIGATNLLDNAIDFDTIYSCSNASGGAIRAKVHALAGVIQGNDIRGNFVTGNKEGLYFDGPAGSPDWDGNTVTITAIDGTGAANSRGITCPTATLHNWRILIPGWFGGFASTAISCAGAQSLHIGARFSDNPGYAGISANGVGVNIYNTMGEAQAFRAAAIQAQAATASRAAFNTGSPIWCNAFTCFFTTGALAANAIVDTYVYSPFTDGQSDKFRVVPHCSQPLVVQSVEDASTNPGVDGFSAANQVLIRWRATAAVAAHTWTFTVQIQH